MFLKTLKKLNGVNKVGILPHSIELTVIGLVVLYGFIYLITSREIHRTSIVPNSIKKIVMGLVVFFGFLYISDSPEFNFWVFGLPE